MCYASFAKVLIRDAERAGRKMIFLVSIGWLCCLFTSQAHALGGPQYVTGTNLAGAIPLVQNRAATPLVVGAEDWPGVIRAVGDLAEDVQASYYGTASRDARPRWTGFCMAEMSC